MLHTLQTLANTAVMERTTLLLNHVLASEPVAAKRLQEHAGRSIRLQFDGWPALLPALPVTAFRVTPAGLLEWLADTPGDAAADLRVAVDASNPALAMVQALGGERPRVEIAGDAAFAADVDWLFANLRWDVQDDLARIVGDAPAREIARLGGAIAAALRQAARAVGGLGGRAREAGAPPR